MLTATEKAEHHMLAAQMTMHLRSARRAQADARWRIDAGCSGLAPLMDVHRPKGTPNATVIRAERPALAICWTACPVRRRCQAWVLALDEDDDPGGVCGGMTEGQRRIERRIKHTAASRDKEARN